jgi:putative hydrolase of HD superfamily
LLDGMVGGGEGEAWNATRENAAELRRLWEEYEAQETAEAKFVKDCDRIEMILQALEYETRNGVALDTFFESTKGKARFEQTISWDTEIRRRRAALHK